MVRKLPLFLLLGLAAWLGSAHDSQASPGTTERVSVASDGTQGNDTSGGPLSHGAASGGSAISGDGRFVAFPSLATNLVADDTLVADIFVHDRQTGVTTMVSVDSAGVPGNNESVDPDISGDGRFVAFKSAAWNLVAGDSNGRSDIFVHDRETGSTSRVSVHSSGNQGIDLSIEPAISTDGRFVAFRSPATLVAGDSNFADDIFVHDRQTGATTRVSVDSAGVQGNNSSAEPSISADGRFIAFASGASNLVAGDSNESLDVFVHDRQTGGTTKVSVDSAGEQGNGYSREPAISGDGRFVSFTSDATNLVDGTIGGPHVYVHDRQTGATTMVSVDSAGVQGDGGDYRPDISGDGRLVTFQSTSSNLVAGDTNSCVTNGFPHNCHDIFVHDRQTGTTTRASVDSAGAQADERSYDANITAGGNFVAFTSKATNLVAGDTNGFDDVFVHEVGTVPDPDSDGDSSGITRIQATGACPTGGLEQPAFRDCIELFMGTDPLDPCADTTMPNDERGPAFGEPLSPWPPDGTDDQSANVGDVIKLFRGIIGVPANYTPRSDFNADGVVNSGDVIAGFKDIIGTNCA